MKNKLGLIVMSLVLLLVLALGPVATGLVVRMTEPPTGTVEAWDGSHGILVGPTDGGGSGGG